MPLERLQRNSDLPGNPTNLLFSDRTGDGITLHWTDTATNEVYYDVERSTDGVNFTGVGELMPVANPIYSGDASGTFRDTGLSPHPPYYHRLVARNLFSLNKSSAVKLVMIKLSGNKRLRSR